MTPEAARTRVALEELAAALEAAGADVADLAERTRARRGQLGQGVLLRDVLDGESGPLVITLVTDLLDRLSDAGAAVRRAEALQLRSEGLSQAEIAAIYGVTRQRVAALLAPRGE